MVVFDKVRENTAGLVTSERSTYTQAANLALNQTLVRSINTSLTALIPVASILFIGGTLLGTGTLNDLSLVLFVGMLSGTYSSLCIATPVLADLKEREPAMRKLRERVTRREAGGRAAAKRSEAEAKVGTAKAGTGQAATRPAAVSSVAVEDRDTGDRRRRRRRPAVRRMTWPPRPRRRRSSRPRPARPCASSPAAAAPTGRRGGRRR